MNGSMATVPLLRSSLAFISVLKRLSKQRVQNNREIPSGSLPDLEEKARTLSSQPEAEQRAYVEQILAQMTRAIEEDHLLAGGGSHLATDRATN